MLKRSIFYILILIFILNHILPRSAYAYSYGNPGEEPMAEAYKELEKYVENDDWQSVKTVYETYKKEFDLYFTNTQPDIEQALEKKDADLLLKSWQAAMRLNIERRLHFAQEQFDDYGQAKLLLAKARGTFTVLEPILLEQGKEDVVNDIYTDFDVALEALGNPGLFGIGSKESDRDTFDERVNEIIETLRPLFPIVSEMDDDRHLTEENLDFLKGFGEEGSSTFWVYFTGILALVFIGLIVLNKRRQKS